VFAFHMIGAALAAYGGLYLASSVFAPGFFVQNLAFEGLPRGGVRAILHYARMAAVAFGVGLLLYHAAEALVCFAPRALGNLNEGGGWRSTRESIKGFIAFWGAIACTTKANEVAAKLAAEADERAARYARMMRSAGPIRPSR